MAEQNELLPLSDTTQHRCEVFVRHFLEIFLTKINEFYNEALGKTKKSSKTPAVVSGGVGLLLGPLGFEMVSGKVSRWLGEMAGQYHHKIKAKRVIYVLDQGVDDSDLRSVLVERGLEIFRCFESQFCKITSSGGWRVALGELALDAVDRIMNYIVSQNEKSSPDGGFYTCLETGFLRGEPKGYIGNYISKYSVTFCSDEKEQEIKINKLYDHVGLVVSGDDEEGDRYYERSPTKYGYRLSFKWECRTRDILDIILKQHKEVSPPEQQHIYELQDDKIVDVIRKKILETKTKEQDLEKAIEVIQINKALSENILKSLRDVNSRLQKQDTILELIKKILSEETLLKSVKSAEPLWFEMRDSLLSFTGRAEERREVQAALRDGQVVVICGLSGIGKSELALSCAAARHEAGLKAAVWIGAETRETAETSFRRLCKRLNYRTRDRDGDDIDIKTIVSDMYAKYFNDAETLFIFDNAESFESIRDFLPLNLPPDKKVRVLITSSCCQWGNNVRCAIREIELDNFNEEEAVDFLKRRLKLGSPSHTQSRDLRELSNKLHRFPLALQQISAHITDEESCLRNVDPERAIRVSHYSEEYDKKAKTILDSRVFQSMDGEYKKTTYIALKIQIDKIKRDKDCGQEALEILNIASYFASDSIPPLAFRGVLGSGGGDKRLGAVIGLLKRSSILKQSRALSIHGLVQKVIRTDLRDEVRNGLSLEEITLDKGLTMLKNKFGGNETKTEDQKSLAFEAKESIREYVSHVLSIWKYASQYGRLVENHILAVGGCNIGTTTFFHLILEHSKYELVEKIVTYIKNNHPQELPRIVDMKDTFRAKCLHSAALNADVRVTKLLIENGANVKAKKIYGWTPLHLAARSGHGAVCEELLRRGARPDANTGYRFTPLHLAAKNGFLDVVRILLETEGTDVNAETNFRFTALHFAVMDNGLEMVRELLEAGAYVDAETSNERQALHLAAGQAPCELVRELLQWGAHPGIPDKFGLTPKHIATEQGNLPALELMQNTHRDQAMAREDIEQIKNPENSGQTAEVSCIVPVPCAAPAPDIVE